MKILFTQPHNLIEPGGASLIPGIIAMCKVAGK
jgi:hypothetical protein